MCFCSPDTMYDLKNFTLEAVGWDLKTIDHNIEECERREIHVVVDGSGHAKIRNSASHTVGNEEDARASSQWTSQNGIESPRQVGANTMDVRLSHVRRYYPLPSTVCVLAWQAWTQHRNPWFDSSVGLVPQRMIVDALHCLFLGVVQRYCGQIIHQLVEHDVWQVGDSACEVHAEASVSRLRDQLFGW